MFKWLCSKRKERKCSIESVLCSEIEAFLDQSNPQFTSWKWDYRREKSLIDWQHADAGRIQVSFVHTIPDLETFKYRLDLRMTLAERFTEHLETRM